MTSFEQIQREYLPRLIMTKPANFENLWNEYCSKMKPLARAYNKYMQQKLDQRVKIFGGQ